MNFLTYNPVISPFDSELGTLTLCDSWVHVDGMRVTSKLCRVHVHPIIIAELYPDFQFAKLNQAQNLFYTSFKATLHIICVLSCFIQMENTRKVFCKILYRYFIQNRYWKPLITTKSPYRSYRTNIKRRKLSLYWY